MNARRVDIQYRKDRIFEIAVNVYVTTLQPVSSNVIAKSYYPELSSASIRNILAELEDDGYLMHPHTSAGRVPTERGYRYYVDHLMHRIDFLREEKQRIDKEYRKHSLELEFLLEKASKDLSEQTQYTAIISVDDWEGKLIYRGLNNIVGYLGVKDILKMQGILKALEDKKKILEIINQDLAHNIEIFIGNEIEFDEMENCSLVVSSYTVKQGLSGRMAILGPTRMNYEKVVSTIGYFVDLMEDV